MVVSNVVDYIEGFIIFYKVNRIEVIRGLFVVNRV